MDLKRFFFQFQMNIWMRRMRTSLPLIMTPWLRRRDRGRLRSGRRSSPGYSSVSYLPATLITVVEDHSMRMLFVRPLLVSELEFSSQLLWWESSILQRGHNLFKFGFFCNYRISWMNCFKLLYLHQNVLYALFRWKGR